MCPGEETIAAFVAGRLDRHERDGVDNHLDTCSGCQELVAMLAKLEPPKSVGVAATIEEVPRDREAWSPGGQLGRYVLLARLGAGGMGVVYSAYDPELDRRVALKVLRRTRAGEQLREEARAIARLAHPNVVAVHDVGTADDEVFVAMEHVDGTTVREWLLRPRTPAEIVDVFVQAGRGLAAAHRVGLVHRDIKPSNIIVGADGRARVLDFGLARATDDADTAIAGTPAYMAPEQERGERIDARADQFAFCVALWEALSGRRPVAGETGTLDAVSDRITRALRRGLSASREARFASMDALLEVLAPAARHRRWVIATFLAVGALGLTIALTFASRDAAPSCSGAGADAARVWGDPQRAAVRSAFAATKVGYASTAAAGTIGELDRWSSKWQDRAVATCRATVIDRVQPAELHALRTSCLAGLLDRLKAIVAVASKADADVVARADVLASSLPAPARCDDVAALSALPPLPPAERDRDTVAKLRAEVDEIDAELLAGRAAAMRPRVTALVERAKQITYPPLHAQVELLVARMEKTAARYDDAIAAYHRAAQSATAARDLAVLAEVWVELSQTLGNDPRRGDQAEIFDRYAEGLIGQLPDRDMLALRLEFARCNRNGQAADAARLAAHCQATIDRALGAQRYKIANAARSRLGHFQRMQGKAEEALATLTTAVDEAIRVHGPEHPDTAVARHSLGIALLDKDVEAGLAQLRQALATRRAAFPGATLHVAESLQGLGDALSLAGKHADAIAALEEALAMLAAAGQGEGGHAASVHILLGMSLQEVKRDEDALAHFLRAADIADRSLQHREALAAMALRLAATVEAKHDRNATGVTYLERALRLQERGKSAPAEVGKTQVRLAELLASSDRARARAMAQAARTSFQTAGASAKDLAEVDAFIRKLR